MKFRQNGRTILTLACVVVLAILIPRTAQAQAQDPRVASAMQLLESMTAQMGPAKIEGTETVAEGGACDLFWIDQNQQQFRTG